jgi:hypothetical protein
MGLIASILLTWPELEEYMKLLLAAAEAEFHKVSILQTPSDK